MLDAFAHVWLQHEMEQLAGQQALSILMSLCSQNFPLFVEAMLNARDIRGAQHQQWPAADLRWTSALTCAALQAIPRACCTRSARLLWPPAPCAASAFRGAMGPH